MADYASVRDQQTTRTEAQKSWRKIKGQVCSLYSPPPEGSCEQYGVERERKAFTSKRLCKPYQIGEVGRSGEKMSGESEFPTQTARRSPEVCARSAWLLGFCARSEAAENVARARTGGGRGTGNKPSLAGAPVQTFAAVRPFTMTFKSRSNWNQLSPRPSLPFKERISDRSSTGRSSAASRKERASRLGRSLRRVHSFASHR